MTAIGVIVALVVAVVCAGAGYFIGYNNRKKTAEAQIGSAEAEAILHDMKDLVHLKSIFYKFIKSRTSDNSLCIT